MPKYVRLKGFSKLGDFTDALEQAFKADALRPKQDRRTARALFAQIKVSGYTGGYTRVTDFIRAWRASAGKDIKAFVPLKFDLGEAFQFDWSEEGMVVGGIYYRMQVSHMKLCASRAFWLVVLTGAALEAIDTYLLTRNEPELGRTLHNYLANAGREPSGNTPKPAPFLLGNALSGVALGGRAPPRPTACCPHF